MKSQPTIIRWQYCIIINYFLGMEFRGLTTMDMLFVNTWICGFQIILQITKVNNYFVGILNSRIAQPIKTWN